MDPFEEGFYDGVRREYDNPYDPNTPEYDDYEDGYDDGVGSEDYDG